MRCCLEEAKAFCLAVSLPDKKIHALLCDPCASVVKKIYLGQDCMIG